MEFEELVEQIEEELVMLSLLKDVKIHKDQKDFFQVIVNRRPFIRVYTKMRGNKRKFMTKYKMSDIPAMDTVDPKNVLNQVKMWIEKETMKD